MNILANILLYGSLFQGGGLSVNVPVQNPSFEQVSVPFHEWSPCGLGVSQAGFVVTGWVYIPSIVPFQPNSGVNPCNMPPPPSGSYTIELGSTVAQDLGVRPSDLEPSNVRDGHYVLSFYAISHDLVYPAYYEAKILFGKLDPNNVAASLAAAHELCSTDGWVSQNWTQVSWPCPSPRYVIYNNWPIGVSAPADPEAHIIISFSHVTGWPVLIAGPVSLIYTPTN